MKSYQLPEYQYNVNILLLASDVRYLYQAENVIDDWERMTDTNLEDLPYCTRKVVFGMSASVSGF